MRTASRILLSLVLALAAVAAPGADDAIFTLTDRVGDDHGDGTLLYPANDDFKPGTLDLRSFSAWPVAGGVEFEAVFARAVSGRGISSTARSQADSLATSARRPGAIAVRPEPGCRSLSM
jgi:hypothetical protein